MAQRVKRLSAIQETQFWSLGREDPLEKEMATHSSTIAWKIPWTEEPGGRPSMESQRVGHDFTFTFTFIYYIGFSGGSDDKDSACHAGDLCSIPGSERSPGEGNGYPLQYSWLEYPQGQNSLVGYSQCGHKELDTTEWLSTHIALLV